MNTFSFLPTATFFLPSSSSRIDKSQPIHQLRPPYYSCSSSHQWHNSHHHGHRHSSLSLSHSFISHHHPPLCARRSSIVATTPPSNSNEEGTVSVVNFEDLMEKDWSFLESDNTNSAEERERKINRIISAGEIGESCRVLVSIGSEKFVDQLVEKSNCNLLIVVHESLFVLAGIKEKHDKVKCWQGELIYEPENWAPLDAVFLYFLPGVPFKLDQIFESLAKCCLTGARIIISHPQGREGVEQQRREYPDVVISELPENITLQKVAADHSFELAEYVDEPGFYLAVLKFCKVE